MNDSSVRATTLLLPSGAARLPDMNWEIRATGDINGDGSPDIVWQNRATGMMAVWYFSGATRIGTNYLYTAGGSNIEPDLDWKIVGAGDMDRDGQVDLIWRHRLSGEIRLWHMNANVEADSVAVATVGDASWAIVGVADLNRDGLLDLVWWHGGTGTLAAWYMSDALVRATPYFSPRDLPDTHWHVVGVGDLNADGKPDLVWQNVVTGELGVWFLNGVTMIGGRYLNPPAVSDPLWRIVGVK
jgi:hypothetical protein